MKLVLEAHVKDLNRYGPDFGGDVEVEIVGDTAVFTVETLAVVSIACDDILALADLIRSRRGGPAPAQVAAMAGPFYTFPAQIDQKEPSWVPPYFTCAEDV